MNSDFKYSTMLSKVCDFPDTFLKSGLLETSQLGLTQAEANVSSHCWKFQLNGCAQSTAEHYHRIASVFLDKYLICLTTVSSKHRTCLVHCSGSERWVWMGVQRGWCWVSGGSAAPQGFLCLAAALLAQASPSLHLKLGCSLLV